MLCEYIRRWNSRLTDPFQDHFTTDYFLVDGAYGSIANGSYRTLAGDQANLITGKFQLVNGSTGNIYSATPTDRPDTSTLPVPTLWTSSGVGSAIPGSQLGNSATYATTSFGSYLPLSSTVSDMTGSGGYTTSIATTLPGHIVPGTSLSEPTHTVNTTRPSSTPPVTSRGKRSFSMPMVNGLLALLVTTVLREIVLP